MSGDSVFEEVRVYDNGGVTTDRYTVVFPTGDAYLMSSDADQPNGVCMYAGENIYIDPDFDKRIDANTLPEGVKKQIKHLLSILKDKEGEKTKQIVITTQNGAKAKIPVSLLSGLMAGDEESINIRDENGWNWNIKMEEGE